MLAKERKTISIKGFARPVRTFNVKGIYDELAAEGRVIHCHQNGLPPARLLYLQEQTFRWRLPLWPRLLPLYPQLRTRLAPPANVSKW